MKYYDSIPENFLLLRFVVTRFCNYKCPYCYVPKEKLLRKKTMFSHHTPDEWIKALEVFNDHHLELYFTGGEPTLFDDFIFFLKEMVVKDFVHSVRIDSNLARVEKLLEHVQSSKVKFLTGFHPTQISLEKFLDKLEKLEDRNMLGFVNVVASKENMDTLKMQPHRLVKSFEGKGYFVNVAKDFERGLKYGYNPVYREYIDKLQHPLDNEYMNLKNLNRGMLCGPGKHYIFLSRHGNIYSCGGKCHGNLFNENFHLKETLVPCELAQCPSIISYSFSSSNDLSPVEHLQDYVNRNRGYRKGLSDEYMECLWNTIQTNDLMPKTPKYASVIAPFLKLKDKRRN